MVHELWILDTKIKISSPFQNTNLWSEFQTWFSNSMMRKSCLVCFKDSTKPPHMDSRKLKLTLPPSVPCLPSIYIIFWNLSIFTMISILNIFKARVVKYNCSLSLYIFFVCINVWQLYLKKSFKKVQYGYHGGISDYTERISFEIFSNTWNIDTFIGMFF